MKVFSIKASTIWVKELCDFAKEKHKLNKDHERKLKMDKIMINSSFY
jgi:hypothetical protein